MEYKKNGSEDAVNANRVQATSLSATAAATAPHTPPAGEPSRPSEETESKRFAVGLTRQNWKRRTSAIISLEKEKLPVELEPSRIPRFASGVSGQRPTDLSLNDDNSDEDDLSPPPAPVRPGAIRIPGILPEQSSQPTLFDDEEERDEGEEANSNIAANARGSVVAAIVDDDQLFHELLFRRRSHDVVAAENVVTVMAEPLEDLGRGEISASVVDRHHHQPEGKIGAWQFTVTRRWIAAVAIVVLISIVAVVTGALVYQSRRTSSYAPDSRLDAFRSVILNHSASNETVIRTRGSPQYVALYWLANDDYDFDIHSPADAIIDRFVLAVIYFGNNGLHWPDQCNFLSNYSVCMWDNYNGLGTFCNTTTSNDIPIESNMLQETTVTKLALVNNSLQGTIPTELGNLTPLSWLDLGDNRLFGTIPSELHQLSNLIHLRLGGNLLSGTIPSELGQLSELTSLRLDENQLTGTIPTELGQLFNLTSLDLSNNKQLSGTVPTELASLSKLAFIGLTDTNVSGH